MTRVNTIHPKHLTNEWLIAEWREIPRIVNELDRYPSRLVLKDIPPTYTLNAGHVKFFRNKLLFIQKRHNMIIKELTNRGINFDHSIKISLDNLAPHIKMFACNDWIPTKVDHSKLIVRLDERFILRKKAYHLSDSNGGKVKIDCADSYATYKNDNLIQYLD